MYGVRCSEDLFYIKKFESWEDANDYIQELYNNCDYDEGELGIGLCQR